MLWTLGAMASALPDLHIDVPSSPSSIQSPEPSGTPVLRDRPLYRNSIGFGFAHGVHNGAQIMAADPVQPENDLCKWLDPPTDSEAEEGERVIEMWNNSYNEEAAGKGTQLYQSADKVHAAIEEVRYAGAELSDAICQKTVEARFVELTQKVASCSMPDGALKPSSQTVTSLQRKLEDLKSQLSEEKHQRQVAAQRLMEQRQEFEKQLTQRQEMWEEKLREIQKEKYSLSIRLQELEEETPQKRITRGEEKVLLTKEEIQKLRQEILEQEALIRGYQVENERAMEKMKDIQVEAKEKARLMAEENAFLASQLANLQLSARQSQNHGTGFLPDNITQRSAHQSSQAKELHLKLEIAKLQEANMELERRLADIESAEAKRREQMASKPVPRDTANQTEDKHNDNYELLCKLQQTIVEQADLISDLKAQLDTRSLSMIEYNVRSGKNSIDDGKEMSTDFGQDHSQLGEKDLGAVSCARTSSSVRSQKHPSKKLSKDMDKQIQDIRSFYITKIKDLNKKLEASGKENSNKIPHGRCASGSSQGASKIKELKHAKERISTLEDIINCRDATIRSLQNKLALVDTAKGTRCEVPHEDRSVQADSCENISHRPPVHKRDVPYSETARVGNVGFDGAVSDFDKDGGSLLRDDINRVVEELCRSFDGSNLNQSVLRKVCCEAVKQVSDECGKKLETRKTANEISEYTSHGTCARNEQMERYWKKQFENSCQDKKVLEKRINDLEELNDMHKDKKKFPRMLQMLKDKVEEMEITQKEREGQWQDVLEETKRRCSIEQDMAERKWQLAMEAKNAEIERFRVELDAILEAAMEIQKAQLQASNIN